MSHNCDLSVFGENSRGHNQPHAFFRLLRINNITAGPSTKGLEQIPDDREQEERKEGKKDGASGDVRSLQGGVLNRKKRARLGCVSHIWNSSCRRKRREEQTTFPNSPFHSSGKRAVSLCLVFVSWPKIPLL